MNIRDTSPEKGWLGESLKRLSALSDVDKVSSPKTGRNALNAIKEHVDQVNNAEAVFQRKHNKPEPGKNRPV